MRFTSTARKDGRWWVVQNDQHPGAISQVSQLAEAAAHQREAIAWVAGLDEADIEVEVLPEIGPELRALLEEAKDEREHAAHLVTAATEKTHKAVELLHQQGFTVRDIGTVLGVSYQRAHQIIRS